jgi:hyperosmotically inducible protein
MNARMILLLVLAGSTSYLVACDRPAGDRVAVRSPDPERRGDVPLNPMDQKEDQADITVTATIRRAIMADGAMSVDAQNVVIVTRDGVATLRGQVDSEAERAAIVQKATDTAGVVRVDDQMTVKAR